MALRMSTKGTNLVNTRNLTTTATTTAQLQYIYIVNELNQDVQYVQGHNLSKKWYIKLVKKEKGINMPRTHIF